VTLVGRVSGDRVDCDREQYLQHVLHSIPASPHM
jgi:hypothetical protein